MKRSFISVFATLLFTFQIGQLRAQKNTILPANPDMTVEARALLNLYYSISGKYILTGQHNYPLTRDRNTRTAVKIIGKTPAIWSCDFGFSKDGDQDSYLSRPDMIQEAIRQHRKGSIITLCWHAVPPTADEPITFQPQGPVEPGKLASVQGRLLEDQYKELLTPGTELYKHWAKQVDTIAFFLKQLQDAHVPVLWRPYHEMNGNWFWWGERVGPYSTVDIYRQLFNRLVKIHHLNNLVWCWNVDRPSTPIRKFSNFYPGNDYLDILSLDVYGSDFNQAYYDSLLALSKGKPILFGEVGQPPLPEVLNKQPLWTSWVIWAGMTKDLNDDHLAMLKDPRVLGQEDPAFWKVMEPYRKACGLPLLPLKDQFTDVHLSGIWVLDESRNDKRSRAPIMMILDRDNEILHVKKYAVSEFGEDMITNDDVHMDGMPVNTSGKNFSSETTASWDGSKSALQINIQTTRKFGERSFDVKSVETWTLSDEGATLEIIQTTPKRDGGETKTTSVYKRE